MFFENSQRIGSVDRSHSRSTFSTSTSTNKMSVSSMFEKRCRTRSTFEFVRRFSTFSSVDFSTRKFSHDVFQRSRSSQRNGNGHSRDTMCFGFDVDRFSSFIVELSANIDKRFVRRISTKISTNYRSVEMYVKRKNNDKFVWSNSNRRDDVLRIDQNTKSKYSKCSR